MSWFFVPRTRAQGGSGPAYVTDGLVMYVDAGDTGSYPGSGQSWFNLVASPADGAAQTDYDWWLGATSASQGSDPTFNSAGAASYFSYTSAPQYHTLKLGTSMPTFLRGMHKAGARFSIEAWVLTPGSSGGSVGNVFDSGTSDQGGSDNSRGIEFSRLNRTGALDRCAIRVGRDTGGAAAFARQDATALTANVVHMIGCSIYDGGGAVSFLYKDGNYVTTASFGETLFTCAYSTPGTTDPAGSPRVAVRGDAQFGFQTNTRVYLMRIYNTNLSKAQFDQNWNATKARFGL